MEMIALIETMIVETDFADAEHVVDVPTVAYAT